MRVSSARNRWSATTASAPPRWCPQDSQGVEFRCEIGAYRAIEAGTDKTAGAARVGSSRHAAGGLPTPVVHAWARVIDARQVDEENRSRGAKTRVEPNSLAPSQGRPSGPRCVPRRFARVSGARARPCWTRGRPRLLRPDVNATRRAEARLLRGSELMSRSGSMATIMGRPDAPAHLPAPSAAARAIAASGARSRSRRAPPLPRQRQRRSRFRVEDSLLNRRADRVKVRPPLRHAKHTDPSSGWHSDQSPRLHSLLRFQSKSRAAQTSWHPLDRLAWSA
jgi:hypothetical protein